MSTKETEKDNESLKAKELARLKTKVKYRLILNDNIVTYFRSGWDYDPNAPIYLDIEK